MDAYVNRGPEREDEHYAVVASTPRSGTTFMYGVLAHLGLGAGHEHVFSSSGHKHRPPEWVRIDVSGFAGLHPFTNEGPVLHQIRDPLKVISSLVAVPTILSKWLHGHSADPEWVARWYLDVFWYNEQAATETYRIEDVTPSEVCRLVKTYLGDELDESDVEAAFNKSNRNGHDHEQVTYADLGLFAGNIAEVRERFGYG